MNLYSLIKRVQVRLHIILFGRISYFKSIGGTIGTGGRFIGNIDFGSEPYLITIGDNVSITSSSFVNHDGGVWVFRNDLPKIDVVKPILIGNNVFIGAGCTILPGVCIGDGVVIGAGSIVTKNLKSNAVYAGVPAKFIKSMQDYKESSIANSTDTKGDINKKTILIERFK